MSRIWAGADWPSAVKQGLALGRAPWQRGPLRAPLQTALTLPWDGMRSTGVCYWKPTPPALVFPPRSACSSMFATAQRYLERVGW
jgi:hypothetical protein